MTTTMYAMEKNIVSPAMTSVLTSVPLSFRRNGSLIQIGWLTRLINILFRGNTERMEVSP